MHTKVISGFLSERLSLENIVERFYSLFFKQKQSWNLLYMSNNNRLVIETDISFLSAVMTKTENRVETCIKMFKYL